jgi:tetratricopeptide (TPR) repeat protein
LLGALEQSVFCRLSTFAGGFTLEAAGALCGNDGLDEIGVLDAVTSLVDKSLVLAEPWEEDTRYRLLESTREYGREKLLQSGELDESIARHAHVYADFVEGLDEQHEALPPAVWRTRAEPEIENLRSALQWAFSERGETHVGQRIARKLPRIFGAIAPAEGQRWVKAAIGRIDQTTPQASIAELELAQATFASVFNHFNAALKAAQRALELFTVLGDEAGVADAQRFVGRSLVYIGQLDEGEALLQEALKSHRARNTRASGSILGDLAVARALQGDVVGARALFAQASEAFSESHNASKLVITAATLAEAEFRAGSAEEAIRLAQEAAAGARDLGRFRTLAAILRNMAAYELHLQRYDDARAHALEALDFCTEGRSDEVLVVFALQHLAAVEMLRGDSDADCARTNQTRAAQILGFVEGRLTELEVAREHTEQVGYVQLIEALLSAMGDGLVPAMEVGRAWTEERAIAEARAMSAQA